MNLAGVERVLELEDQLDAMARKVAGAGAPRDRAEGGGRAAGGAAPRAARGDRPVRARRRARARIRPRVKFRRSAALAAAACLALRRVRRRQAATPRRRPSAARSRATNSTWCCRSRATWRAHTLRDRGQRPRLPGLRGLRLGRMALPALRRERARAAGRSSAYLRAHGAREVNVDATGLFVDADVSIPDAEAICSACVSRAQRRMDTSPDLTSVPATTPTLPRLLKRDVTGVIGLDTRPIAYRRRCHRHPDTRAPTPTPTPPGCAAGRRRTTASRRTSTSTPTTTRRCSRLAYCGQGERVALVEIDGFKSSDIPSFAHCFRPRHAADQRVRRGRAAAAAAGRRGDARPRGSRRRRAAT